MKLALNKQTSTTFNKPTMTAAALLTAALLVIPAVGCVSQGKYNDAQASLASTQMALEASDAELAQLYEQMADIDAQLLAARSELDATRSDLSGELNENSALQGRINRLEVMRAELERSNAMYLQFVSEFAEAIAAGNLQVLIENGRVTIALPENVLFASGEAEVRENGLPTLTQIAVALAQFDDRRFQVEGHTDNVPISTRRFPSNWELSAARALNVVGILVEQGVSPTNLSGAGYASYEPRSENDTEMGRQMNRRVEIVLVPDLSFMESTAPTSTTSRATPDPS